MTQVEYAAHLGCTQGYVAKLVKTGKIPESALVKVGKRFKIVSEIADEALDRHVKQGPAPKQRDDSYVQARIEGEKIKTRLKEIELQKKTGELVLASEVQKAAFNKARLVRDAILNVPDRIGALLAAESDTVKLIKILKRELQQALEELSR